VAGDKAGNWTKWYTKNIPDCRGTLGNTLESDEEMSPRTLKEQLKRRPVNKERVTALEESMMSEVRTARLAEIRQELSLNQTQLAEQLHVSQNRVSRIERGDIEHTQLETLRKYIEALGGTIEVTAKFGSQRYSLTS
jgi:ribosome-binding protein aMBF1 (putative translation factor)